MLSFIYLFIAAINKIKTEKLKSSERKLKKMKWKQVIETFEEHKNYIALRGCLTDTGYTKYCSNLDLTRLS